MQYRTGAPTVGQPVVYQNADTNSSNRIQSVSPQSNVLKLQYPPAMSKMYHQQGYQNNCSNLMVSILSRKPRRKETFFENTNFKNLFPATYATGSVGKSEYGESQCSTNADERIIFKSVTATTSVAYAANKSEF